MAVKFLEPGGDATFNVAITTSNGFWDTTASGTIATDFVHGGHIKSIKYALNTNQQCVKTSGIADAGTRASFYIYLNALPNATASIIGIGNMRIRLTSGGVLQLWNGTTAQVGSNGSTLSTGIWYRISLAYTITSTSVNRFEQFLNGVSDISVTNATVVTGGISFAIGNLSTNTTLDMRSSDHYVDDSSALTDPGNIWVTAKRPNANGTTNGFTTQIGSGGSGYGTGHSPQVNERALSTTNGWSITSFGATTEEYNIESQSTGDIDISTATIIDYMGWVSEGDGGSRVNSIIVNGVSSNFTSGGGVSAIYTKIVGSSTYPAGTGADIGMTGAGNIDTYSLFECGIVVAYIPAAGTTVNTINNLSMLGVT